MVAAALVNSSGLDGWGWMGWLGGLFVRDSDFDGADGWMDTYSFGSKVLTGEASARISAYTACSFSPVLYGPYISTYLHTYIHTENQ